jgi:hypothetical protein
MSYQAMEWAFDLRDVSPLAKLVAIRVADVFPPLGEFAKCSRDGLLEWTGAPEAALRSAVAELVNNTEMLFEDRGWWFLVPIENTKNGKLPEPTDRRKLTIYVISRGRFIKVGISLNALERLKQLQGGAPEQKFELIWKAVGPAYLIRKVEKATHESLAPHLVGNEWFAVSANQAIEAVRGQMERCGLETPAQDGREPQER